MKIDRKLKSLVPNSKRKETECHRTGSKKHLAVFDKCCFSPLVSNLIKFRFVRSQVRTSNIKNVLS